MPSQRWINLWVPIGKDRVDNDNDIDEEAFVGNLVIVLCVAVLLLVLHILVVSAVEAHWLQSTEVRRVMNQLDGKHSFESISRYYHMSEWKGFERLKCQVRVSHVGLAPSRLNRWLRFAEELLRMPNSFWLVHVHAPVVNVERRPLPIRGPVNVPLMPPGTRTTSEGSD